MAAPKRKENPNSKFHVGGTPKKPRTEEKLANGSKNVQDLETATDSDPLVESDTTSQSGDDDGVSWPSDEETQAVEEWESVGATDGNDDGGKKIAAEAVDASKPAKKISNTTSTASGMSESVIIG